MLESNPFTNQFINELPKELVADSAVLQEALGNGYVEFTEWAAAFEQRAFESAASERLGVLRKQLEAANQQWQSLACDQHFLRRFAGPNDSSALTISAHLNGVAALISEYEEWFDKPHGGQTKTQSGSDRLETLPLDAFIEEIKPYWDGLPRCSGRRQWR